MNKVVCIVDNWKSIEGTSITYQLPIKGEIYTIREQFTFRDIEVIRLVEIVNPIGIEVEPWFELRAFRPVDYAYGETVIEKIIKESIEEFEKV